MKLLTGTQLELNLRDVDTTQETKMDNLRVETNPIEKLPTLLQFLKLLGKKKIANSYAVAKVWKPGKFPNFSIETEKFRISIAENNPAFKAFSEFLDTCVSESKGFAILVDEDRKGGFEITTLNDDWSVEELGDRGFRFYPTGSK